MSGGQTLPIRLQEVVQLKNVGVKPENINFSSVSLESEKFVTICEKAGTSSTVAFIELANPASPQRRPISAESALMNPVSKVLALRAGNSLQIFNIDMKSKMKSTQLNEQVVFWRWISTKTLALVTPTVVYHWSMEGSSEPVKIFDRDASLASVQVIDYVADESEKWLCLVGIQDVGGRIGGSMQLYNVDRKVFQLIPGHAVAFAKFKADGAANASTLFAFATRDATGGRVQVIQVTQGEGAPAFQKRSIELSFPADVPNDFPVAVQASSKYDMLYVVTKFGYIHLFDIDSGTCLFRNRISAHTVFKSCSQPSTGGMICVNRDGQLLSVTVNEKTLVSFVCDKLQNVELGIRLASRNNLPGAEQLFQRQFDSLMREMKYRDAAELVARSPGSSLRNETTLGRFQNLPQMAGQAPPLLQYLSVLLEKGALNKIESVYLARVAMQQGRVQLLEKWINENKIECSEELGDMIRQADLKIALAVYLRANVPHKVINSFIENGAYDKILMYCEKTGHEPDWTLLLNNIVAVNPQAALDFALKITKHENGPKIDRAAAVDAFVHRNHVQEATSYLLEVLDGNNEADAALQTRLLEINLMANPQVADAILGSGNYSHFDKARVADMCEKAGLFQRALEMYDDLEDIKRVIVNTQQISPEFLVNYFGSMSVEWGLESLREILRTNKRQNMQIVVQIAGKYSEQLTPEALIAMFEEFEAPDGLYYYLGSIVNFSQDPEVHFKYIEAAAKVGQLKEVDRITRESTYYDPERVKDFLKEAKLSDPRPLINVCDRFDFVYDLTTYLYNNNMRKYIEVYVEKVNPTKTGEVAGALLDLDADESFVESLILSARANCPAAPLVENLEKRNRLKLLLPWLQQRLSEGSTETAVHDGIAKIYIDTNQDAEKFLKENQYYDSKTVGKYCEKRDPYLAFVAYRRGSLREDAVGSCDNELIEVTNNNSLFKLQARFLVEREDLDLWTMVLQDTNEHRRQMIDQVVSNALPECKDPDRVSCAVKAFMNSNLMSELVELLEKLVLGKNSSFANNHNLQNLLLITAIREEPTRVMEYAERLENYDGPELALVAIEAELFEEAFFMYKRFDEHVPAVRVLLDNLDSIDRAVEFAETVDKPDVWFAVAGAQLHARQVSNAVASYLRSDNAADYKTVIQIAEEEGAFAELVKFLRMARKHKKDSLIDTELVYSLCRTDSLSELEEFVSSPSSAKIQAVGERVFEEGLYRAAKILFSSVSNYARLAAALVKLGDFQGAVDAARKANSTRSWKDVTFACVDAREFRLAQIAALNIVVHADELEAVVSYYERRGHFAEIIAVLESGLSLERAHTGMYTELGILYAKHKPEKLLEHINLFWQRINIPKLIRVASDFHLWRELSVLYVRYDEFDNAVRVMMEHSPEAWDHVAFKDTIIKVSNTENQYKAVTFYLEEQPMLVNDLLQVLSSRVDHTRVVHIARRASHVPLIKPYLAAVQENDVQAVNDALNELYIEEGDYESLRLSIDTYENFDKVELARRCEKHDLLEFRRIAAYVYKKVGRFEQSVALSKKDDLYRDAMQTAAESKDEEVVEGLLRFFVDRDMRECFAACLYTCYDAVRPDVALELAWRNGMMDFAMPFMIQSFRDFSTRVKTLEEEQERMRSEKHEEKEKQAAEDARNLEQQVQYGGMLPAPGAPTGMPFMPQGPPPGAFGSY